MFARSKKQSDAPLRNTRIALEFYLHDQSGPGQYSKAAIAAGLEAVAYQVVSTESEALALMRKALKARDDYMGNERAQRELEAWSLRG